MKIEHLSSTQLNCVIAERVFGLTIRPEQAECSIFTPDAQWEPGGEYYYVPVYSVVGGGVDGDDYLQLYSQDMNAAWSIVEHFQGWNDQRQHDDFFAYLLSYRIMRHVGEDVARAICLAALEAIGVKEVQDDKPA